MAILLAPGAASARQGEVASSRTSGSWPAWSPNGRKIAFLSVSTPSYNFDEFVMNADGSGQRRVTRAPVLDSDPAWSPDSRRLVFVSGRPNFTAELYVMNADGSGRHRLTHSGAILAMPAWSPNGRKIAFEVEAAPSAVWGVNADGKRGHRLAPAREERHKPPP